MRSVALAVVVSALAAAQAVEPTLNKYCVSCHNASAKTANLNLAATPADAAVWQKVLDRVVSGKMPPPGLPMPTAAEKRALIEFAERKAGAPANDPGRVTARRLNRTEYNNTVRDLLGVALRPADEFPVDDSGYGFDNIGDVLSVSPMLAEKYMAAARKLSRAAVFGEPYPEKPTLLTRLLAKRSADAGSALNNGNYLPYSMRGALYGTFRFPVDGEYELRFRVVNFRGQDEEDIAPELRQRYKEIRRKMVAGGVRRSLSNDEIALLDEETRRQAPPRKVVLSVDGAPVLTSVVEGTTTFEYDRGELVARVPVKAGERLLRASYPELADLADPRENLNRDMRRKLFVDYLDIVGPFKPSAAPPPSYRRLFACAHPPGKHDKACARTAIAALARRAYRRPPTSGELDGLNNLAASVLAAGDTVDEAVRVALQAILCAPQFLFRTEQNNEGVRPVNSHEMASRLSYFLWASMPDDELLHLAAQGKLAEPQTIETQVRRMLADPRSRTLVDDFAAQWLQLRNLDRSRPDPAKFPTVDDELVDAMRTETRLFLRTVVEEDRSLLELLDAPFTFVNGPLARHYGIPGVDGEQFRRVALPAGGHRSGLLTQASILTVSSYPARTSPVMRGKWVLENLLGTPPPAPPADVPQLDESKIGSALSLRQQLEEHRKNPACAVCHLQMDAIGFGLEGFDASGKLRTHDGKFPVDTAGTMPDGKAFAGAGDLKQILKAEAESFSRNVVEKMLTYALGRGVEPTDRATIESLRAAFQRGGYRFSTLVTEIARSAPFRQRRSEAIAVVAGGTRQ